MLVFTISAIAKKYWTILYRRNKTLLVFHVDFALQDNFVDFLEDSSMVLLMSIIMSFIWLK